MGQVSGPASGVAALTVSINGAAAVPLALDLRGRSSLRVEDAADGAFAVRLVATHRAGNHLTIGENDAARGIVALIGLRIEGGRSQSRPSGRGR